MVPRRHETLLVLDGGQAIEFTFADLLKYHGFGSPGGVALAFKAMELALPALGDRSAPERHEVSVQTPFTGPGARDGFECVLRAASGGRYAIDRALERSELGPTRGRFIFLLTYRSRLASATLRAGFVTEEFLALAGRATLSAGEEQRLVVLKQELAERVISAPAARVFDLAARPDVRPSRPPATPQAGERPLSRPRRR